MDILNLVTKKDFYISDRKEFISGDLQPIWRVSLLLLILYLTGRDNKASRNKVHLVNWTLKNPAHASSYSNYVDGNGTRPFINLDPALDKAIDYAMYSKLLTNRSNRLQLTASGKQIALKLEQEKLFVNEKAILSKMKKLLTEANVKKSLEGKS